MPTKQNDKSLGLECGWRTRGGLRWERPRRPFGSSADWSRTFVKPRRACPQTRWAALERHWSDINFYLEVVREISHSVLRLACGEASCPQAVTPEDVTSDDSDLIMRLAVDHRHGVLQGCCSCWESRHSLRIGEIRAPDSTLLVAVLLCDACHPPPSHRIEHGVNLKAAVM
jgi:hypothetical protein